MHDNPIYLSQINLPNTVLTKSKLTPREEQISISLSLILTIH